MTTLRTETTVIKFLPKFRLNVPYKVLKYSLINQALCFIADNPLAVVGIAIVSVAVGAGIMGCLCSHALDVIEGEVGGHSSLSGTN